MSKRTAEEEADIAVRTAGLVHEERLGAWMDTRTSRGGGSR